MPEAEKTDGIIPLGLNLGLWDRMTSWQEALEIARLADELYALIVETASGRYVTRSEENGYREIAIWKTGVTL